MGITKFDRSRQPDLFQQPVDPRHPISSAGPDAESGHTFFDDFRDPQARIERCIGVLENFNSRHAAAARFPGYRSKAVTKHGINHGPNHLSHHREPAQAPCQQMECT